MGTEKDAMAEILQGFDFYPPVSDHFGQLCQAKNFFFLRDDPYFWQFPPVPDTIKNVLVKKVLKKKKKNLKLQFFFWLGTVEISLIKWQNMAILRLSWRGSTNNKKYIMQLICVKKDCFYPIQVLGMKFLYFRCISQRSKVWRKFPN